MTVFVIVGKAHRSIAWSDLAGCLLFPVSTHYPQERKIKNRGRKIHSGNPQIFRVCSTTCSGRYSGKINPRKVRRRPDAKHRSGCGKLFPTFVSNALSNGDDVT